MRLSVRKEDPGYSPRAFGAEVYLNGKKVEHCFTADEETGEVFVFKTDSSGEYILNRDGPDPFLEEERLTGQVEIRLAP